MEKNSDLLRPFIHVLPLADRVLFLEWQLQPTASCDHPLLLSTLSSIKVYKLLQPAPWIQEHANPVWHLRKFLSWWKKNLTMLWKSKMPFKQRLFLWKCLTLPPIIGVCLPMRLFFICCKLAHSKSLLIKISGLVWETFLAIWQIQHPLSRYSLFFYWVRYWAF